MATKQHLSDAIIYRCELNGGFVKISHTARYTAAVRCWRIVAMSENDVDIVRQWVGQLSAANYGVINVNILQDAFRIITQMTSPSKSCTAQRCGRSSYHVTAARRLMVVIMREYDNIYDRLSGRRIFPLDVSTPDVFPLGHFPRSFLNA